ncbi:MAG: hypothetical protein L6R41_000167 [Letrouitia leprolyta]|nr:MAG: hypothetical protein L6R41_000167 [Letrouitia leprolyta]
MLEFTEYSPQLLTIAGAAIGIILYGVYGAVWRLYLSPIAAFPGPRFAALTFWNEFYYDVWLGGKYTWKIADYHRKYGPIVRINPYEIHINDPWFWDKLYVGGSQGKTDKWDWSIRMFGQVDNSAFDTLDHDKHRMRRAPWNPYFSKQSISRIQPLLIQNAVNKLCSKFAEYQAAGKPAVMTDAYASLTTDVISEYSFPEGYDLLSRPGDFDWEHYHSWMALSRISHSLKQFPWLYPLLDSIPAWVTRYTSPDFYVVIKQQNYLLEQAKLILRQRENEDYKEMTLRPSLIRALIESDLLPEDQKHPARIKGEAQISIGAGTLTTSHALKVGTYHILANQSVFDNLMDRLKAAIPNPDSPPTLQELERIPYLMAIMYETLRIFSGVSHRLSRIFPDRPLVYKEWSIPPGTPMSMTPLHIHENEEIFPSPHDFQPERWLPLNTNGQRLLKFLVPFGGGSRICVGMELGKAEFLTAIANVFRRFGDSMVLWETIRERDVDTIYDVFNPMASRESNGVMVLFRKDGEY